MANTDLTIGQITQEALDVLKNTLVFAANVNREYDDSFARKGAKIGDTVNVRKPVRYIGRRTAAINVENSTESSVPVTLNTQYGTDFSFTSAELTLAIDDFSNRYIKPAVANIANMIDFDGLQLYKQIYNHTGTPGTTPTSNAVYLGAGVKLDNSATPRDGNRNIVLNPQANASIVNTGLTLFNPAAKITKQYTSGMIGNDTLGFDWYMDQNVGVQTIGTYAANVAAGAVTVQAAVATGNTVVSTGWTAGDTLNQGDIVSFAGVFAANPQNRQSTGLLAQFVLLAGAVANGSGVMTLTLSPALVFSGQNQNVTAAGQAIAAGAVVQVYGASATPTPQNLSFHRDAFTFANAPLELPGGVDMASRVSDKDTGMSIRMVRAYDINNDRFPCRLDLLGGWAVLRPELACRVSG